MATEIFPLKTITVTNQIEWVDFNVTALCQDFVSKSSKITRLISNILKRLENFLRKPLSPTDRQGLPSDLHFVA